MTAWSPVWTVNIDGIDYSSTTLNTISLTNGRLNVDQQPAAASLSLELLSLDNVAFTFKVGDTINVKVENSSGVDVNLFTGNITDLAVQVRATGTVSTVTVAQITALGTIARLNRNYWGLSYTKDTDGDLIDYLLSTVTGISVGSIDTPGAYDITNRGADIIDYYQLISLIANSAQGYIWESGNGDINYADENHRRDYLQANGYEEFTATKAIGRQLRSVSRLSDIKNISRLNYGTNYGSQVTAFNSTSLDLYGSYEETINTVLDDNTQAANAVSRRVQLRSFPRPFFDQITFPLSNPDLTDTERNTLIGIFMGMPIQFNDLPANIADGGVFYGFVEKFTFTGSQGNLDLTIQASESIFSIPAQKWSEVNGTLQWDDVPATYTWVDLIGETI